MALHRLAFVNSAFLGATTVTASSQQADLPASNLKSPARGALWRSAIGWNVVAGFNDLFLYAETLGVTTRRATITPGAYVTGDDYAAAAQSAMNAAPGHTNTYTVTYSATTNKFTIARATGTDVFYVLGRSLTSADRAQSSLRDVGFYDIEDGDSTSSGTTFTSDTAVHHSMEYVDLDQGPAAIRVSIVAGVNDALDVRFNAGAPVAYYISPGVYSDPDVLAAAIDNAKDSGGSTFSPGTVAWDPALNKFTINSVFAGTLHLLFGTGANAVALTSAHVSLGWASTDVALAAAATSTADSEVWGWNPLTVALALDHNAVGGGIMRIVASDAAITGQIADVANAEAFDFDLIGNELQRLKLRTTTYGRRYIRLVIEDPRNEDAFSDLGILWAGPVIGAVADQDFAPGWTECNDPKDVVNETEYGAVVGELRPAPYMFSGQLDLLSSVERDTLQEMQDYTGLVRPILFLRDPLNAQRLMSMTWYARLTGRLEFTSSEGINNPSNAVNAFGASWSATLSFREIMP